LINITFFKLTPKTPFYKIITMVRKLYAVNGVRECFHSIKEPYEVKVSRAVLKERYPFFKVSTLTRLKKIRMRNNFSFLFFLFYFLAILGGSLKNTEKKITPKVPASRNTYTNVSID
jgi:hypothetical protein